MCVRGFTGDGFYCGMLCDVPIIPCFFPLFSPASTIIIVMFINTEAFIYFQLLIISCLYY